MCEYNSRSSLRILFYYFYILFSSIYLFITMSWFYSCFLLISISMCAWLVVGYSFGNMHDIKLKSGFIATKSCFTFVNFIFFFFWEIFCFVWCSDPSVIAFLRSDILEIFLGCRCFCFCRNFPRPFDLRFAPNVHGFVCRCSFLQKSRMPVSRGSLQGGTRPYLRSVWCAVSLQAHDIRQPNSYAMDNHHLYHQVPPTPR